MILIFSKKHRIQQEPVMLGVHFRIEHEEPMLQKLLNYSLNIAIAFSIHSIAQLNYCSPVNIHFGRIHFNYAQIHLEISEFSKVELIKKSIKHTNKICNCNSKRFGLRLKAINIVAKD